MRTRIKFCGMTRVEDVDAAVQLGADAIGLVFYPASARFVEPSRAAALVRRLPPFVSAVGLFVNPAAAWVREVVRQVPLSMLQFHGDETPETCAVLAAAGGALPWLRALAVPAGSTPADLLELADRYAAARGVLLDTPSAAYGGSGRTFDWSCIPDDLGPRAVLAGGLNARNVADAVRRVRPFAVDVSSGIEAAGAKGVKDAAEMAAFAAAVRTADATR